jgi:hypothetical protein
MTRGTFICLDFYCIFLFPDWLDSGSSVDRSRGLPIVDCGLWVVEGGPGL